MFQKYTILIALFLFALSCKKDTQQEKNFRPEKLSKLSLENIVDFWEYDSIKNYANPFNNYFKYIGGIGLSNVQNKKRIGIAVFESQKDAIADMNTRIKTVSWIINPYIPNENLNGNWWFIDSPNSSIFVNQWNTIIEVSYIPSKFEEVKTLLQNTAIEIAKRVDNLSEW